MINSRPQAPPFGYFMKKQIVAPVIAGLAISVAVMSPVTSHADGFLGLFKKDKPAEESPFANGEASGPEVDTASAPTISNGAGEAVAATLFSAGQSAEASKDFGKARDLYKDVVKKHPKTSVAAESQYKIAEIREIQGDGRKAFDEYQNYIDNYPGGPRFSDALGRQYVIAEYLQNNRKNGFLGIGASIQPSKLLEMYDQIALNAPRSAVAPRALYNKGLIHADQGSILDAISSFETLVEEYPGSKESKEAQYFVVQLREKNSERSFSPIELRAMQEAGEDFITQHGDDPRAQDVRAKLGRLENQEADKMFDIARYYERNGNLRSAAVYYREILKKPGSDRFEDAKTRMSNLLKEDPSLAATAQRQPTPAAQQPMEPVMLPQASQPAPAKPIDLRGDNKPSMRTGQEEVIPIPSDDPVVNN